MAKKKTRSQCPISCALDLFGDKWTLLLVRDIAFFGKNTYNEFLKSEEGIASNILANRLRALEAAGIISRKEHPESKAKIYYTLTPRGLDLVPVLFEISLWADSHLETPAAAKTLAAAYRQDREKILAAVAAQLDSGEPLV